MIGKFAYLNCYFEMYVCWKSKKNKGFNDMIYDIWFLMKICEKYWFLSLYVDEVAYRLPGKQNTCSGFPAVYKLDYLHTNLIFKHSNKIPKDP